MSGSFYFSVSFAERMPACTRKSKRERQRIVSRCEIFCSCNRKTTKTKRKVGAFGKHEKRKARNRRKRITR